MLICLIDFTSQSLSTVEEKFLQISSRVGDGDPHIIVITANECIG